MAQLTGLGKPATPLYGPIGKPAHVEQTRVEKAEGRAGIRMTPIRRPLWLAIMIFFALASLAIAIHAVRAKTPAAPAVQAAQDRI